MSLKMEKLFRRRERRDAEVAEKKLVSCFPKKYRRSLFRCTLCLTGCALRHVEGACF